jgi:CBS domain-containing protein
MKMQQMKDVMTRQVQVVSPDATLKEAAALMREKGFGMLPVGENDRMIGTITDRDIAIRAVAEGKNSDAVVRDVMTKDLVWAYEDDTVERGARRMSECQIRRLPVVNADKRLVGIVSLGDFAVEVDDIRLNAEALEEISRP